MVLFEWEKLSNKPVRATESNLAAWKRYEHLRARFWMELMDTSVTQNKRQMQRLRVKHARLEQHFGGYPFRNHHDTIGDVHVITVEASHSESGYFI
jgi:hypothetical protein